MELHWKSGESNGEKGGGGRGLVQVQEVDKEDSGGMKFREASGIRKMKINLFLKHHFLCSQCPMYITLPWYSPLCMEVQI